MSSLTRIKFYYILILVLIKLYSLSLPRLKLNIIGLKMEIFDERKFNIPWKARKFYETPTHQPAISSRYYDSSFSEYIFNNKAVVCKQDDK